MNFMSCQPEIGHYNLICHSYAPVGTIWPEIASKFKVIGIGVLCDQRVSANDATVLQLLTDIETVKDSNSGKETPLTVLGWCEPS